MNRNFVNVTKYLSLEIQISLGNGDTNEFDSDISVALIHNYPYINSFRAL